MLAGVDWIWKSLVGGALAIACGAWAVGSLIGVAGSPQPHTGDPVVIVTTTSPPTGSADSRPAESLEDDDGRRHSGGTASGDAADDDERDSSRPAAPVSVDENSAANGQTGATGDRDDGASEVGIPRRVEDPDDHYEDDQNDDQNEDDQDGDDQDGDNDDGGGKD